MKKAVFTSLFLLVQILTFGQTYANKEWQVVSGSSMGLNWSQNITSSSGELITVGNTLLLGQGVNILTTKVDKNGNILWQSNFNLNGSNSDYGVSLHEDISGNVIVVGTVEDRISRRQNIVLLKYDLLGNLI